MSGAEVNISPKINISAQPLNKALHKTPEAQKLWTEVNISTKAKMRIFA